MPTDLFASAALESCLEGVIARIVFSNPDTGWSVASLRPHAGNEPVVVIGNLAGLGPGEEVRLEGAWERDRRYGRQFRVRSCLRLAPRTAAEIERYLASGVVRGIGPVLAQRLVAHFGTDTLRVLDETPARLREVRGLGTSRAAAIGTAWQQQRDLQEIVMFLQAHELSPALAPRVFRAYGAGAAHVLRHDPYRLARDLPGIGFHSADRIAGALGLCPDSTLRIEAGVLHVLDTATSAGHCFLPRPLLAARTLRLLAAPRDGETAPDTAAALTLAVVDRAIQALVENQSLCVDPGAPEIAVYTPRLLESEIACARALQALLQRGTAPSDPEKILAGFATHSTSALSASQRQAVVAALGSRLLVITGGPGTGKTTLVRTLIEIFEHQRLQVVLSAPTGRAAKRLAEAARRPASTLHRLLEWSPRLGRFHRHASLPLDGDVFIVDETSMVDLPLLDHLLRALPPRARLICVGDADQLPSVGPGAVLGDMIASDVVPTVRLTELFRQEEDSLIVHSAHRIRQGHMPQLPPARERASFVLVERREPEAIVGAVLQLVGERLPEALGVDARTAIQVLTPMHRGPLGTTALNLALQQLLNPDGDPVGDTPLRCGDKVMQMRNDYDLDVWNGDLGRIEAIDPSTRSVVVRFDERSVRYGFDALDALALAYASTVHKAQGSEVPVVVLVLHSQHHIMLQRNLIYTAVTRARQQVVIVGEQRALRQAVGTARRLQRYTRLASRLQALSAPGPRPA